MRPPLKGGPHPALICGAALYGRPHTSSPDKIAGVQPVTINAVLDYDFGPQFNHDDLSGVISREPPRIKRAIPILVPRVNEDGNEVGGIASVLPQAPLGSHVGWNVEAAGFFEGQI